jgi:hypothetical protein
VVNTDEKLKGQLQKVIENSTKPENVDLSMFPWEQENRPYSVFMFVVNAQETASHKSVGDFIIQDVSHHRRDQKERRFQNRRQARQAYQ